MLKQQKKIGRKSGGLDRKAMAENQTQVRTWTHDVGSWRWIMVLGLGGSDIGIRHLLRQGFLFAGDQVIPRVPFQSRKGPCHLVWAVGSRRERDFAWVPNDHHLLPCKGR